RNPSGACQATGRTFLTFRKPPSGRALCQIRRRILQCVASPIATPDGGSGMPAEHEGSVAAEGADWGLLTNGRLPDRGPRYTETPADPYAPGAPFIAEPWNAVTAALFVVIVAVWAWRLRGRYDRYPFLCCCLPILLAGGIGGTLYHALRTSVLFFLLDVVPIMLLGLAGSIYMAVQLPR